VHTKVSTSLPRGRAGAWSAASFATAFLTLALVPSVALGNQAASAVVQRAQRAQPVQGAQRVPLVQQGTSDWRAVTLPMTLSDQDDLTAFAIACISEDHCIVGGGDNDQPGAHLMFTLDAGQTWDDVVNLPSTIEEEVDHISCTPCGTCWATGAGARPTTTTPSAHIEGARRHRRGQWDGT
jgi:hypothetical protein